MVDYLLVGNGPAPGLAAAVRKADAVVQINDCRHAQALPPRTRYVFLTNSGPEVSRLVGCLSSYRREDFPYARIVLARNPAFYTLKQWLLRAMNRHWRDYELSQAWTQLRPMWPIETVSFLSALRLDRQLRALGMPGGCMPSTGMIAYDWLSRRLDYDDTLAVEGFTFEGWEGHPWNIERQLIRARTPRYSWQDNNWARPAKS
jgi:hypothetical protein